MEPRDEAQPDSQLEAFLDGLMDPVEADAFAQKLRQDSDRHSSVDLQRRIDEALKRQFLVNSPELATVTSWLKRAAASKDVRHVGAAAPTESRLRPKVHWVLIAIAAGMAWCAVVWQLGYFRPDQPHFEPQPLVKLYAETLQAGFQPYYECHDAARFADTFKVRLGKPLQLAALPDGSHMLGLSYVGGLSRETTAMLCLVANSPVMVFVDRAGRDSAIATQGQNSELHVFRTVKYGLVFYEVSPLAQAQMMQYLVAAN